MRGRNFILAIYLLCFCMVFTSAGIFDDVFQKITGNAIKDMNPDDFGKTELENITCEEIKDILDKDYNDFEIPEAIPFKTEVFNIYIDDEFFIFAELEDSKLELVSCDKSENPTYNVYVKSKLIFDAVGNKDKIKPIDYYNENRKNGQLKIKPVGIGRKLKMSFINFGLKIAGLFD